LPSSLFTLSLHDALPISAFVFAFLILLCDGADIGILAFSLTSLKAEWGLTSVQAGALGSYSLSGMGIGGFVGGWACDKFGRVRVDRKSTRLNSSHVKISY